MKLIYAIIHDEDVEPVMEVLMKNHFSATKLSSTGGFLKKGNTTLMIGTEAECVEQAISLIKQECGQRQDVIYNAPYPSTESMPMNSFVPIPVQAQVGGAILFVVDVERYERV